MVVGLDLHEIAVDERRLGVSLKVFDRFANGAREVDVVGVEPADDLTLGLLEALVDR